MVEWKEGGGEENSRTVYSNRKRRNSREPWIIERWWR